MKEPGRRSGMSEQRRIPSTGYNLFLLLLSLFALANLAAYATGRLRPETAEILQLADVIVCVFFLADFLVQLATVPDKLRYFFTWGWLDLLSSIPTIDAMRWGRLLRMFRIVRVLRGIRAAKLISELLHKRAQNAALAAFIISLVLITFSSIAILRFEEFASGGNIKNAQDALWWTFATITTVGYGDRYPVTAEGRLVAAVLMSAGVGLFSTFSAFLATWFLGEKNDSTGDELAALRAEVASLRNDLKTSRREPRS